MKRIEPKRVRVQMDQVTGELVRTVLDAPQLAYERARDVVHSLCADLDPRQHQRFREKVAAWALEWATGWVDAADPDRARLAQLVMMLAARVDRASEVLSRVAERDGVSPELAALLRRPCEVWVRWEGMGRNGTKDNPGGRK